MEAQGVAESKGWLLYAHPVFLERFELLTEQVEGLRKEKPSEFHHHPIVKLYRCVSRGILEEVPTDPGAKQFVLGATLGPKNKHWRRIKNRLPPRYRLFFQFKTTVPRTVIYAWLNDEETLRAEGSKSDCYVVFEKMLSAGTIPTTWSELRAAAEVLEASKTA